MTKKIDLLICNSSKLITLDGTDQPRTGEKMRDLGIINSGAVAVDNGIIVETGTTKELLKKYSNACSIIDAGGNLVMPGFVDCHTHAVYAGSREYELGMKISGASYLDILKAGGGIHSTVRATRALSEKELFDLSSERLNSMLRYGTTTVEIKSGYGLDFETEKKILEVINSLGRNHPCDIVSTYLGAHAVPSDMERGQYISMMLEKALPEFKGLAEYCDIFTEDGAYTIDETKTILGKAKFLGYKLKIHAGQFNDLGAAGLASELGAISADHLEFVSTKDLELMKKNGTAAVLMPGVPFFLMNGRYPDARKMITNGNILALATDFNPGSCPTWSMQMVIALACYNMKMSPEEAITASTINSAYAIGKSGMTGSLSKGKKGDIIVMDISEPAHIPYYFGANLVKMVFKGGKNVDMRISQE